MGTLIDWRRRFIALPTLGLVLVLLAALVIPAAALAKGRPTVEAGNNLSVPTIMVGSYAFNVACGTDAASPSVLVTPTGTPSTGYAIDPNAYYYVQGVNTWQAQCFKAPSAVAKAAWGDNLGGDASLKVGSPVRVELGLFDDTGVSMDGYTVVKLQPLLDDRYSAYGTLAARECVDNGDGTQTCTPFAAAPTSFSPVRVYDSGVKLAIAGADDEYVVGPIDPTAEINATGAVVYGYNWRPDAAGQYTISFTTSTNVSLTGTDVGTVTTNTIDADLGLYTYTVSLPVTVAGGGGGGGGQGYHGH